MNSSETYLKEIKKAATGGNADAQLFLAKLYSEGFPQDFDEAAKWAHLHSSETYLKLKTLYPQRGWLMFVSHHTTLNRKRPPPPWTV